MKIAPASAFLHILIIAIAAILFAIVFSHSALLLGNGALLHIDSQVYIYTAEQLLKGKVLYRDVFDHKGPIMYLFECAGLMFGSKPYTALWLLQWLIAVLGISPLFIFWAKKYNALLSITTLLLMAAWIYRTKTIGDNLPEIYAIAFISFSYFCCLKIIDTQHSKRLFALLLGASSMGLFLLKPNLTVLILPCIMWLIYGLSKPNLITKHPQRLLFILLYCILGGCLFLFPFVLYFFVHNAWVDALFACWTFNFSYISNQKLSMFESIAQVFFKSPNYLLIFILLAAFAKSIFNKDDRALFFVMIILFLLSVLLLIGLPGRGSESVHYAIPLAPLLAWLVIYFAKDFNKFQLIVLVVIAVYFCKPLLIHLVKGVHPKVIVNNNIQYINAQKKQHESLCVLGNRSSVYEQTGLQNNTRFFYTYPLMQNCNSEISKKFVAEFMKNKADWILFESQYDFEPCITQILREYNLVSTSGTEQLYRRYIKFRP